MKERCTQVGRIRIEKKGEEGKGERIETILRAHT